MWQWKRGRKEVLTVLCLLFRVGRDWGKWLEWMGSKSQGLSGGFSGAQRPSQVWRIVAIGRFLTKDSSPSPKNHWLRLINFYVSFLGFSFQIFRHAWRNSRKTFCDRKSRLFMRLTSFSVTSFIFVFLWRDDKSKEPLHSHLGSRCLDLHLVWKVILRPLTILVKNGLNKH